MSSVSSEIFVESSQNNEVPDAPPLIDLDIPAAPPLSFDDVPSAPSLDNGSSPSAVLPQFSQVSEHRMRQVLKTKIIEEIKAMSEKSKNLLVDLKNKFDDLSKTKATLEKDMIDLAAKITQAQRQIEYFNSENQRLKKVLEQTKKLIKASSDKEKYKEYHRKYNDQAKKIQDNIAQNDLDKPKAETELKTLEEQNERLKQEIENLTIRYKEYEKAYQKTLRKEPIFTEPNKPKPKVKNVESKGKIEEVTLEVAKIFLDPAHYEYDEHGEYDPLIFVILKNGLLEHRAIKQSKSVSKITPTEMEELQDDFISRIQPAISQANLGLKEMLTDISKIIGFDIQQAIESRKKQPFNQNASENCKSTNYMFDANGGPVSDNNSPIEILKTEYFKEARMENTKFSSMMKNHLESGKITEKRINQIISERLGTPYSIVEAIKKGKAKKAKLEEAKIKQEATRTSPGKSPNKRKRTEENGLEIARLEQESLERIKKAREEAQRERELREAAEAKAASEERLRREAEAKAKEEARLRQEAEQRAQQPSVQSSVGQQPRRRGLKNRSRNI